VFFIGIDLIFRLRMKIVKWIGFREFFREMFV